MLKYSLHRSEYSSNRRQSARRVSVLKITPSADHKNNNATLQGISGCLTVTISQPVLITGQELQGEREDISDRSSGFIGKCCQHSKCHYGWNTLPNSKYRVWEFLLRMSLNFLMTGYQPLSVCDMTLSTSLQTKLWTPCTQLQTEYWIQLLQIKSNLGQHGSSNSSYSANLVYLFSVSNLDLTLD